MAEEYIYSISFNVFGDGLTGHSNVTYRGVHTITEIDSNWWEVIECSLLSGYLLL